MKYYAGIDLGGTKIYSIVIDETGNILSREKVKTYSSDNFEDILKRIVECYEAAVVSSNIPENQIVSVGMAVPAPVNVETGVLLHAPNLNWKNISFSQLMFERIRKPFFIDNDANMGTFGEFALGQVKEYKNIYGIFVGTGIGGGYIANGELVRGKNFTAGEVGHMIIEIGGPICGCGKKGCFEAIAGKVGIIEYLKRKTKEGEKTILNEISPDWKKSVGSSALAKCYLKNDKLVVKALSRSAKAIGIAISNIINLIGVEAIVLGGGVIEELGDVLIPTITEYMVEYTMSEGAKGVKILKSTLGDDAVALGAAWSSSLPENKKYLFKG
jgi:glucokinase